MTRMDKDMTEDLKKMYRTVMDDHFPADITISFGDQVLRYRKDLGESRMKRQVKPLKKGFVTEKTRARRPPCTSL